MLCLTVLSVGGGTARNLQLKIQPKDENTSKIHCICAKFKPSKKMFLLSHGQKDNTCMNPNMRITMKMKKNEEHQLRKRLPTGADHTSLSSSNESNSWFKTMYWNNFALATAEGGFGISCMHILSRRRLESFVSITWPVRSMRIESTRQLTKFGNNCNGPNSAFMHATNANRHGRIYTLDKGLQLT